MSKGVDIQIEFPFPELKPMYERAVEERLWFHCAYQDLWFSPAEISKEWQAGRFRWGAVNWSLRDPHERLNYLQDNANAATVEFHRFAKRIYAQEKTHA